MRGVEADYFNASIIDSFLADRMQVSLYISPIVWTTTKRCAFNSRADTLQKFCMCKKECLKYQAIIENVAAKKELFLRGNAVFGLDRDVPTINNHDFFKRVVFELKS